MDEFKVKVNSVRNEVRQVQQLERELSGIYNDFYQVKNQLRFKIRQRERIDRRLESQGQAIAGHRSKIGQTASVLENIADQYERTERALCGEEFAGSTESQGYRILDSIDIPVLPGYRPRPDMVPLFPSGTWEGFASKLLPVVDLPEEDSAETGNWFDKLVKGWNDHNGYIKGNIKGLSASVSKWLSPWLKEHGMNDWSKDGTIDRFNSDHTQYEWWRTKDGDKWNDVTSDDKDYQDKIKELKDKVKKEKKDSTPGNVGVSVGGDIFNKSVLKGKAEGAVAAGGIPIVSGEAGYNVLQGKVTASGYAGLYQLDPETGELTFKPGISGQIGASVTAFTASEMGMLGGDMLGVYEKASVTVGRVGASGEASVGLYNAKGEFDPSVYAGLKAEAIAGEITGQVGAKVLGADIGLKGSLNYGIGAHLDVGFKDGKLSFDVGASLGVGASVGLEIDVGGAVNAVCDGAKAVWGGITSGISSLFN